MTSQSEGGDGKSSYRDFGGQRLHRRRTAALAAHHPHAEIGALTADRQAGKPIGAVFPHLARRGLPDLVAIADVDWSALDLVFCCLPHGTTQEVIAGLPGHLRILDLSADFRLADPDDLREMVRPRASRAAAAARGGLRPDRDLRARDRQRAAGRRARLLSDRRATAADPAGQSARLIDADDIVIDAKSGVTGAGRAASRDAASSPKSSEGINAYGVANHRHMPEIEQGLSRAAGRPITISFTPHLMPMNRGILSTIYVRMTGGATLARFARACSKRPIADETFVRVLPRRPMPATHHVRGSNLCLIGLAADRLSGRAILVSAIDNLVKGASGQAVQDMNVDARPARDHRPSTEPLFP